MTAEPELHELQVKDVGTPTEIPYCDIARLMYYLDCVACLVEGLPIPAKFRDYKHWKRIGRNLDDFWEMVLLAQKLDPETMTRAGVFIDCEAPLWSLGKRHMFVEITDTRYTSLPTKNFAVGGTQVTCLQRMLYTESWLVEYYKGPMRTCGRWDGRYVYKPTVLARGKRCDVQ